MKTYLFPVALSLAACITQAADLEAGKTKAQTVCAACHGANGTSVSDTIPNLAAQRATYIETQLKALKEGTRKAPIMNAIAAQLSPVDMANVAAYFASLPGATTAARSEFLPHVAKSHVSFPEGYAGKYVPYLKMNFPATKQVRHFYASPEAAAAARTGKPVPDGSVLLAEVYAAKLDASQNAVMGSDGFFVPDKIVAYTAMAKGAGWGSEVPEMLRNGDWNYAVYTAEKQPRPGVNQAECYACHKPLEKSDYLFTLKDLAAAR